MHTEDKKISNWEFFQLMIFAVVIAIAYTFWFIALTDDHEGLFGFFIIPEAQAQILPFEQQLEQIRDPKECTRKVVQGGSAELPFTLKVVYDTSRDIKLEFKQQGTSFPVVQRTNQVMTFFTDGADQYEIYIEVNYDVAKPRQMYIEYLSNNAVVQSEQEKFDTTRFCMTIFANTVAPTPVPTKEEIFGESLDYISQIPAMVTAFNANSQTSATSISYMWILLFAVVILSILTYINSVTGKRKFDDRMRDFEDSIQEVSKLAQKMSDLETSLKVPFNTIQHSFNSMIKTLKTILAIPEIRDKIPEEKKESTLNKIKNIIPLRKKSNEEKIIATQEKNLSDRKKLQKEPEDDTKSNEPKIEDDEVLKALQVTPEEIKEEKTKEEPSGGFVILESEEDAEPEIATPESVRMKRNRQEIKSVDESNPMRLRPDVFQKIMKEIDYTTNKFKEGAIEKFTYTELNESFGWISKYRIWIEKDKRVVPEEVKHKQAIAERLIYYAILQKIKEKNMI
jgi:hypothetical protein